MYALKTCSVEFYILSIFLILIQVRLSVGSCSGECVELNNCSYYPATEVLSLKNLNWCDVDNFIVCCPMIVTNRNYSFDTSKRYLSDCEKWRREHREVCPQEPFIVNGVDAKAKEFPHMALVGELDQTGQPKWFCGGSLISPRFILTAAHCVDDVDKKIIVRLGELDYSKTNDDAMIQDFNVTDFMFLDEEANVNTDIALLKLDRDAEINLYVVPICLPLTNGSEYERLFSAGWGQLGQAKKASPHLKKVKLERFEDVNCQTSSGKKIPESQICAGSKFGTRDTCNGDSGGPLFTQSVKFPCMFEIQGVVSEGAGCGIPGAPSVYTRILYHVGWIESVIYNSTDTK